VAQQTGDLAAAERYLDNASELIAKTMPPAHPASLALRVARARIDIDRHNFKNARADLDFVLANGKSGSALSFASLTRAELNLAEGAIAAAESDARRALTIVQSAQGGIPYSNKTGAAWLMLGKVLAKKGETSAARAAFQNAILNLSNTVDADHPLLRQARALAPS
jgi:tetratricopeptide (TPR) repeat protein